MSLKDKKYKRIYRFATFLFAIILVGLATYSYQIQLQLNEFKSQDVIPLSQFEELQEENEAINQLVEIDMFWLSTKNANATLNKFAEFKDNDKLKHKEWLVERMERLEDIIASSKDDELTKVNLRSELRDTRKNLDSLNFISDSLQFSSQQIKLKFEKTKDSLVNLIAEKSLELRRNETVKVISFRNDNKNLVHVLGEVENEMANGNGIGIWNTGSIYRGNWVNNKRHGKGEFVWDDGAKYVGDFVMGERSGEGVFYYSSGEKYEGSFKKGLRDGYGVLYDRDGNVSYKGNWKNDKPVQ